MKEAIRKRKQIPRFAAAGRPSVWSAADMNVLVDPLNALLNPQIIRGEADKIEISDSNVTIQIGVTPTQSPVLVFHLKDVKGDYLVCRTYTGASDGNADIYVAKQPKHRTSLVGETVLGVAHTCVYADGPTETWAVGNFGRFNQTRTDTDANGNTEDQRILPPWSENDLIFAMSVPYSGATAADGSVITLLHIGDSRQWSRISES